MYKRVYGPGSRFTGLDGPDNTIYLEKILGVNLFGRYKRSNGAEHQDQNHFSHDTMEEICQEELTPRSDYNPQKDTEMETTPPIESLIIIHSIKWKGNRVHSIESHKLTLQK